MIHKINTSRKMYGTLIWYKDVFNDVSHKSFRLRGIVLLQQLTVGQELSCSFCSPLHHHESNWADKYCDTTVYAIRGSMVCVTPEGEWDFLIVCWYRFRCQSWWLCAERNCNRKGGNVPCSHILVDVSTSPSAVHVILDSYIALWVEFILFYNAYIYMVIRYHISTR